MIEDRHGHTSARQAGEIAKEAEVEKLVLTHLSRRYRADRAKEVEQEAKKYLKILS